MIHLLKHLPDTDAFDMALWHGRTGPCGTVCCIGGWAEILAVRNDPDLYEDRTKSGMDIAAEFLGFDDDDIASDLFQPMEDGACWDVCASRPDYLSLDRAIRQLEYLRDTGKVDWSATP